MKPSKSPSPWWKVPIVWMIVGLPLSAVVAATASAVIAFKHQDPMVTSEVHKLGLATTQGKDSEDKAASLGLSARLQGDPGRLTVALSGHLPVWPERLTLRLVHPTLAGHDRNIFLQRVGDTGQYVADAQIESGKRLLILEPGDAAWRLVGTWQTQTAGEVLLAAGTRNPPTHL